jgi:rhamnulokinase
VSPAVPFHLAIDLGAASGRAVVGRVGSSDLLLREAHRFQYHPRRVAGHLRWDFAALIDGVRAGIRSGAAAAAALGGRVESVGVDSWGVDYGLLNADGELIEDPVCYRDERTVGVMEDVLARIGREEVFRRTGIQFLSLNTLYQLVAHVRDGFPPSASRLLMIPDLCHHALCGAQVTETTNASTTQLLATADGRWDATLFALLGLPLDVMPEVVPAGTSLGVLSPVLQRDLGVNAMRVVAPATHDTGSAVAGTPLASGWAYVSSGTWSLVGVELESPLVNESVARANFTNEAGAAGTVRFLKNVMGLWILESCRREWQAAGVPHEHAAVTGTLERVGGFAGFMCPDAPRFFNPKSMIRELRDALAASGQTPHDDPVLLTKVILDSLALTYASVIDAVEALTGRTVPGIHIVGGGARNEYLNQATADASGRSVIAGPVEATATGNLLIQAVACGDIPSLAEGRRVVAGQVELRRYEPRAAAAWKDASQRYRDVQALCASGGR